MGIYNDDSWPHETWQHRRNVRRRQLRRRPAAPFTSVPSGICRLCGCATERPRQRWHEDCAALWRTGSSRVDALSHLVALHGPTCFACGTTTDYLGALEVDHVRPLWLLNEVERTEYRWWLPFNLQLLCWDCHKTKSASEATERRRLARAREAA